MSSNAYDFLRQSIAGGSAPVGAQPTDYSAIQPQAQYVYRDPHEKETPPEPEIPPAPPILTLPPGVEMLDFVARVENAYNLHYTEDVYLERSRRNPQGNADHALDLLEEGLARLAYYDYAGASDLFSLCVILDPNYFYRFCLATARFNLGDLEGTLSLSQTAMEEIRAGQQLSDGALYYFQKMSFVDGFYNQYIQCLIFLGRTDEAHAMTDFIANGDVFRDYNSYFDLALFYSSFGDLPYAAKMIDKVMPDLEQLPPEEKNYFLAWIPNILRGEPGNRGDQAPVSQAVGEST